MTSRTEPLGTSFDEVVGQLRTADGLFITDQEQRVRFWSESAEKILGISATDTVGKHCYEVLMGSDFAGQPFCRSACPVSRNARKLRPVRDYELVVDGPDGSRRAINNSIILGPRPAHDVVHLFREVKRPRAPRAFASRKPKGSNAEPATSLSRREQEVLKLAAAGMRTAQIAEAMGVSRYTARNQLSSVYRKLGVRSRMEAAVIGFESRLV
jgi:DNA-binding CsgD family transcriptional regulator